MLASVEVDNARCRTIGNLLFGRIPVAEEEPGVLPSDPLLTTKITFAAVAICHQTQTLQGSIGNQQVSGWDFLLRSFVLVAEKDPERFEPDSLSKITARQLRQLLKASSMSGVNERVILLRDLGAKQFELGRIETFSTLSKGWLLRDDGSGILQRLSLFNAYKDPVRKKSSYFCAIMKNQGIWQYLDDENLPPPVDYHELRGHLRIGTIRITDNSLQAKIMAGQEVSEDEDTAIRQAVAEVISSIASTAGTDANTMHYAFWNLFRSVCIRKTPLCDSHTPERLPERYKHLAHLGCILREHCLAYRGKLPMFDEPRVSTLYY